ncbi:hypothetical protein ACFYPZ_28940 [Streptomyces sp. NPDC005506]|uniref:hypothetical protein n=1 Tax=Streptomyces sp. NPDC005506 TaxID=3364718 RepID=UPI0036811D3D
MVQGRSLLAPNERLLPTYRLRADDQLRVMRAACSSTDAFINADRLAAATGLTAKNCGLVPAFLFTTGLVEKAGGHFSRYRPTSRGRRVAAAWQHGEAEGLIALREAWKGQWFARSMKERLESGPVARNGLLARLLTAAGAEGHRMRQAEALLDVLVAIGMIFPDGDGFMSWHEEIHGSQPKEVGEETAAEQPSLPPERPQRAAPTGPQVEASPGHTLGRRSGPEAEEDASLQNEIEEGHAPSPGITLFPQPRQESTGLGTDSRSATYAELDLLALLCPPILLADLVRLSSEELMQLHGHLRGLAALTAKLRGQPVL